MVAMTCLTPGSWAGPQTQPAGRGAETRTGLSELRALCSLLWHLFRCLSRKTQTEGWKPPQLRGQCGGPCVLRARSKACSPWVEWLTGRRWSSPRAWPRRRGWGLKDCLTFVPHQDSQPWLSEVSDAGLSADCLGPHPSQLWVKY